MAEFLETTVDKFIFRVATDRLYSAEGIWVLKGDEGDRVRLGVTDYRQQLNGDVAFAHLKPVGTNLAAGDEFAEVETIKATVSFPSPIAGTVLEVNDELDLTPEAVNQEPYGQGWLVEVQGDRLAGGSDEALGCRILSCPDAVPGRRGAEEIMSRTATYHTTVEWKGEHWGHVIMGNGPEYDFSAPPDAHGHAGVFTPEDAYVAAANTCVMMMFIWATERFKLKLLSYECRTEGTKLIELDRTEIFTRLHFAPRIRVAAQGEPAAVVEGRVRRALQAAQKYSLVANSVKSEIVVDPEIIIEE